MGYIYTDNDKPVKFMLPSIVLDAVDLLAHEHQRSRAGELRRLIMKSEDLKHISQHESQ